jgi:hypothetical protein
MVPCVGGARLRHVLDDLELGRVEVSDPEHSTTYAVSALRMWTMAPTSPTRG